MRLSALVVLLGATSCTLGAVLPAKAAPLAKAAIKTPDAENALAKAPAPTAGKVQASVTQSADNAPITSLPFDLSSADKVLAEISTEDKVFSSLDKQLPQSPSAPKVTPVDEPAAATLAKSPIKAQATALAKSSAESPEANTPNINNKVQRTLDSQLVPRVFGCQTPVDNFYVHAAAFRSAMRKVDDDNAALARIDASIRATDAQIRAVQHPQWEPQPADVVRRQLRQLNDRRNGFIQQWSTTATTKNRHLQAMTNAARLLNADEMALRRKDFVQHCRLPLEVKMMINEQIDWNYIDSLLRHG